ncbi:hypothetical protein MRB53_035438 [Persea americana]|uniref:Uncharacterized protein n=1 Tax=Persea americana TaxID=3435 RepID=A0ACC2K4P3_PERAE|nr:hypothetical protein MRB53_035438 [Persea americana]
MLGLSAHQKPHTDPLEIGAGDGWLEKLGNGCLQAFAYALQGPLLGIPLAINALLPIKLAMMHMCVTCNGAHKRPRGAGTLVDAARPDRMGGAHCMAIHGPSSQVIPAYLPVMDLKSHSVRVFTVLSAAAHHSQDDI